MKGIVGCKKSNEKAKPLYRMHIVLGGSVRII
jgi:hypothetical protein